MVQVDVEYKDGNAILQLEQKKFNMLNSGEQELWSIPMAISVLTSKESKDFQPQLVKHMFDKAKDTFVVKGVQPNQPILVMKRLPRARVYLLHFLGVILYR